MGLDRAHGDEEVTSDLVVVEHPRRGSVGADAETPFPLPIVWCYAPSGQVLGWVSGVRYRDEELQRAFFASRFSRVLDALGYVRFRDWRIYGEEGLAKQEAALWLHEKTLTLKHRGLPLSRYDVEYLPGAEGNKLAAVARPRLFESPYWLPQPRLFDLSSTYWLCGLSD